MIPIVVVVTKRRPTAEKEDPREDQDQEVQIKVSKIIMKQMYRTWM